MIKEGFIRIKYKMKELSTEDGSGFLIEFPDYPGCMSDGNSELEAYANGFDALSCWLKVNVSWIRKE